MRSRLGIVAAVAVGLTAGCGGKVVFDTGSSAGGAGGTTSHVTTSVVSTTHATSTHANSTIGTGSVNTSVVGTSVVGTGVGTTNVSAGSVMQVCDNGQPGGFGTPVCNKCAQCAIASICSSSLQAFQNSPDGKAYGNCVNGCQQGGPPGCFQMCQQAHPQGAQLYAQLVNCVVCNGCPNNCDAAQNCMTGG